MSFLLAPNLTWALMMIHRLEDADEDEREEEPRSTFVFIFSSDSSCDEDALYAWPFVDFCS